VAAVGAAANRTTMAAARKRLGLPKRVIADLVYLNITAAPSQAFPVICPPN
jgi:hypothetical protein